MDDKSTMGWCSILSKLLVCAGIGHFFCALSVVINKGSCYYETELNFGNVVVFLLVIGGIGAIVSQKALNARKKYTFLAVLLYFVVDIIALVVRAVMRQVNGVSKISVISFFPIVVYVVFSLVNIRYLFIRRGEFVE